MVRHRLKLAIPFDNFQVAWTMDAFGAHFSLWFMPDFRSPSGSIRATTLGFTGIVRNICW